MQTFPSRRRLQVYGLLGSLAVTALVALALAMFQQVFTPVVTVTLRAERAGLLLDPGADVRLRGLPVGEVRSVRLGRAGGAELELALNPDMARRIPSGSATGILATTPFGAKYVSLEVPDGPVTRVISAGEVLRTDQTTSEVNDVFAGLQRLLNEVDVGKANETLAALAAALDGRGARMGGYVSRLNTYLSRLNEHLDPLTTDIDAAGDVLDTYAKAAPDFIRIARNASRTSSTVHEQAAELRTLLLGLTRSADNGAEFFDQIEKPLLTAVSVLDPVTRLLARYSPSLTCTIEGLNNYRKTIESILGNQQPGIQARVSLLPGQQGYQYPRDLPKLVTGNGPDCFSLPDLADREHAPLRRFNDGSHVYDGHSDTITPGNPPVSLYTHLFGLPEQGGVR